MVTMKLIDLLILMDCEFCAVIMIHLCYDSIQLLSADQP